MCANKGFNPRPSICGICGPIYYDNVTSNFRVIIPSQKYDEIHYSFEKGGPYYTGQIAETYKKGQTIEVHTGVR